MATSKYGYFSRKMIDSLIYPNYNFLKLTLSTFFDAIFVHDNCPWEGQLENNIFRFLNKDFKNALKFPIQPLWQSLASFEGGYIVKSCFNYRQDWLDKIPERRELIGWHFLSQTSSQFWELWLAAESVSKKEMLLLQEKILLNIFYMSLKKAAPLILSIKKSLLWAHQRCHQKQFLKKFPEQHRKQEGCR